MFYMDFQKAFDTVPHGRLLVKLKGYGIKGKTLSVISDFLSDRSFCVNVGDRKSNYHPVTSGIPQGSVLGPLLFLIYINDLPEGILNKLSLFADDLKMYARSSTYVDNQKDIDVMDKWQQLWLVNFNTVDQKCKVMYVGRNNPHHEYYLGGELLPSVENEKDLGVTTTTKMNWDEHIGNCVKKANSSMAWISRTIITRNKDVMLNLYKSLVRPHIEYCVQLWAPQPGYGNWRIIMDIEGVQRKYTRLIEGIGSLTYEERLKKLSLTTLLERRARGDLIETFKIVNGLTNYGEQFFTLSRRGKNLIIPPHYGSISKNKAEFFSRRVVKYWNKLPTKVQMSVSVDSFKRNLEEYKKRNLDTPGNYWELADEVFRRIHDDNRSAHIEYLKQNPFVAKRRGINLN